MENVTDERLPRLIRPIVIEIVRQEIQHVMAGQKYIIDQDQINQLSYASDQVLQVVSDAATAVNAEIAAIPGEIADAVQKALAAEGDEPTLDLTSTFQKIADIQASIHNITVAAQMAGAAAPTTPAAPVSDPATGNVIPVTSPTITVAPTINDASITPTATPASAGTGGTGNDPTPPDPPQDGSAHQDGAAVSSTQQTADTSADTSAENTQEQQG